MKIWKRMTQSALIMCHVSTRHENFENNFFATKLPPQESKKSMTFSEFIIKNNFAFL